MVFAGGFFLWNQRNIDQNPAEAITGSSAVVTTLASKPAEGPQTSEIVPEGIWDKIARSVVYIEALGSRCNWSGSGSLVLDGSYVLTNEHVSGSGECELSVFLTDSSSKSPTRRLAAALVVFDKAKDLAVLRLFDSDGTPFIDGSRSALKINAADLQLGAKVFTLGYPAAGGSTITFTSGDFAGMDDTAGVFYKTTAYMNSGVSGGAGLNERGELIGIPTAGKIDSETNEKLGINLVRPITYAIDLLEIAQSKDIKQSSLGTKSGSAANVGESNNDGADSEAGMDPIFDTCRQAISRGYGPYYRGQDLEYDFYQDRDRDGIVCE
jgi:S1-C subfamily serine protease